MWYLIVAIVAIISAAVGAAAMYVYRKRIEAQITRTANDVIARLKK